MQRFPRPVSRAMDGLKEATMLMWRLNVNHSTCAQQILLPVLYFRSVFCVPMEPCLIKNILFVNIGSTLTAQPQNHSIISTSYPPSRLSNCEYLHGELDVFHSFHASHTFLEIYRSRHQPLAHQCLIHGRVSLDN